MSLEFYDLLEVAKDATPEEIKASYKRLAMIHHPDREGGDEEKLKVINIAYEVLSDPIKRKQYDAGVFLGNGAPAVDVYEAEVADLFQQFMFKEGSEYEDIIGAIKAELYDEMKKGKVVKEKMFFVCRHMRYLMKNLSHKGKGDQTLIHGILRNKRITAQNNIRAIRKRLETIEVLLESINEYRFTICQRPQQKQQVYKYTRGDGFGGMILSRG